LVPTVIADACNLLIAAVDKIPTPTRQTGAVVAAVPAHADPLPRFPPGNTGTQFIDDACDFVPWSAGILDSGQSAFFGERVAVTNTTSMYFDAHLSGTRLGNLALDDLEVSSSFWNLRYLHCCWCGCCRCHKSSFEDDLPLLGQGGGQGEVPAAEDFH